MPFAPLNRPDGPSLIRDDRLREVMTPREFVWFDVGVAADAEGRPGVVTQAGVDQAGKNVSYVQTITYDAQGRPAQIVHQISDDYDALVWTKTQTFDYAGAFPTVTVS